MTQSGASRFAAPLAIGLLVVLALAPVRYVPLVADVGAVVETIITPIAGPLTRLTRGITRKGDPTPEEVRLLQNELERWRQAYRRTQHQLDASRERIRLLQQAKALNPSFQITPLWAPVVSTPSSGTSQLLTVRAGSRAGVEENTVVTVDGIHLLGRIVDVSPLLSKARPITDPASGALGAVIDVGDQPDSPQLSCRLRPAENGRLRGEVEHRIDRATQQAIQVQPGMTVRLRDPTWPRASQMTIVGTVERVERAPNQPLRQVAVVRPRVDLRRVTEVILRITHGGEEAAPAGPGGGG